MKAGDLVIDRTDNVPLLILKVRKKNGRRHALCYDYDGEKYWYSRNDVMKYLVKI